MAAEYELTANDYISILKRRWIYIAVVFTLIFSVVSVVAVVLPPLYESTGTILVEAQQIPVEVVQSSLSGYAEERIQLIKQRVMTRDNLLLIIKKYNLYEKQSAKESVSTLIDEMKTHITVIVSDASLRNRYDNHSSTISFTVSFEYNKADVAQRVANELMTLFLNENVKARTERAQETAAFLSDETDRLKLELETIEKKVALYKQQHSGALPEQTAVQMNMLERSQMESGMLDRDYRDTQDQLKFLEVELANAKTTFQNKAGSPESGLSELDKAKAELDAALIVYKDSHPTVKALKRKVDALAAMPQEANKVPKNSETDLLSNRIQAQIDTAKSRINAISQQQSAMRGKASQLQIKLSESPQVELGLVNLMRDYDNAKTKYEQLKTNQQNAKVNQKLESENKSERFTMLEPPELPEKPIKPSRQKIVLGGFAGGIMAGLGVAMLLEMLHARVRGVDELYSVTQIRPLAIVPYISNKSEKMRKRRLIKYLFVSGIVTIIIILIITHLFIMPLDVLINKIMMRFA